MGWEDETKFLANRFKKLPKTIQDTLVQKVKKFNLSFVISYQLEAVGFLYSGKIPDILLYSISFINFIKHSIYYLSFYQVNISMDILCGSIC